MPELYTKIEDATELHPGDHISWPTEMFPNVLSHHAIVIAWEKESWFRVIHVTADGPASLGSSAVCSSGIPGSYKVRKESVDLCEHMSNGHLRRYDYKRGDCYEPSEVIEKAESKIGEFHFHISGNNCEHFAQLCKTGKSVSDQAECAKDIFYCTCRLIKAAASGSGAGAAYKT